MPQIRMEGDMVIGYACHRVLLSWRKTLWARVKCGVLGHEWSTWTIDDMGGPGEQHEDYFMPYLSRESRPDEFGIRGCLRRGCGASERRYHVLDAPSAWIAELERRGALVSELAGLDPDDPRPEDMDASWWGYL